MGKSLRIQATVCFTPVPAKQGNGGFDTWPSWIAGLFEEKGQMSVRARPALSSGTGVLLGTPRNSFKSRYTALAKIAKVDRAALLSHLDVLWAKWLSDGSPDDFTSLRALLSDGASKTPATAFGDVLQPKAADKPSASSVPDIVAVPRAELARRLTLARARDLLEEAVSILSPEAAKSISEARVRRTLSFDTAKLVDRPWARLPTAQELEIIKKPAPANASSPSSEQNAKSDRATYEPFQYGEVPSDKQWLLLKQHLQEERGWLDAALGEKLKPHRMAAVNIAQSSQSCAASADPDAVLAALREMRSDEKVTDIDSVANQCVDKDDKFQQKLDDDTAVQSASTLGDYGTDVPPKSEKADLRWHSLQGIHALARVVHLVVDIEFDIPRTVLDQVAPELESVVGKAINDDCQPRFVELALDSPNHVEPRLWTLTKVVLPRAGEKTAPTCWPSTIEEWAMAASTTCSDDIASKEGLLDYVHGVVDLEAQFYAKDIPADKRPKRYDVISVDVVLAAEAEQKRHRRIATMEEAKKETRGALPLDDVAEAIEPSTLVTAGLQVIDRWRQAVAVDQFISACDRAKKSEHRLDANDLAIGYKIDVGVTQKQTAASSLRDWRSLTERAVTYSAFGDEDEGRLNISRLADSFQPGQSFDQREITLREVDGAVLASGSRLLRNAAANSEALNGQLTAFTEQLIATWDGDPIGQRTGAFTAFGGNDALPVSQSATLPKNSKTGRAPHRLRFGRNYALGMRSVLMGGVTLPVERAAVLYDKGLGRGLAYPSSPMQLQRFLRHERIHAPIVATAAELLVYEHASNRGGIDSKEMIVRSLPKDNGVPKSEAWRFQPAKTERVLFAPGVDLNFATLHGSFDKSARQFARRAPFGGLLDVDYDSDWGGFPVFDPRGPAIMEAVRGEFRNDELPPERSKPTDTCTIMRGEKPKSTKVPSGFAALRRATGKSPSKRTLQYYPDPAARHMMIALHRPEKGDSYLTGDAIRIPLYPGTPTPDPFADTPGYPDARPVVLRVQTYEGTGSVSSYDDLRKRAGIKTDEQWPYTPVVKGAGSARVVTICLAPGEDFEIEAWCVPDETHLLAWFDAPEAMALLLHGAPETDLAKKYAAIARTLPNSPKPAPWSARRGEATIPWALVREAAAVVYKTLLKQPVAGISSVRRLHALHATGLPKPGLDFGPAEPPGWPISLIRVVPETRDAIVAGTKPWRTTSEDGARDVLIAGRATIDVDTTETLELRVVGASPKGEAFDDPRQGRSYEKRARGLWPRTKSGIEPGEILPIKSNDSSRSYMSDLFGFDVAADGTADVRRSKATLARWTIDRARKDPTVDFLELTKELSANKRAAIEGLFSDTKARRLTLSLAATSRTARHIPDRLTYPTQAEAQVDEVRLFRSGNTRLECILPATERPSALSTKSLLPAFTWADTNPSEKTRKTKIRVRLRRPWWTSGEDERLGVVVWPPNILHTDSQWPAAELKKGTIRRQTPMAKGDGLVKLNMHKLANQKDAAWREGFFSDADLGPGGEYITRWGSDPIFNADDVSWFIAKDAFGDVFDLSDRIFAAPIDMIATEGQDSSSLWPAADRYRPRFVENVLMPIPDVEDKAKNADPKVKGTDPKASGAQAKTSEAVKSPEFMMVSLVTYMPRFDPDFEHWYVDIDLDTGHARDPFVRLGLVRFQPHAQRDLQLSSPVAEWVQVVGYSRQVKISRSPGKEPVAPVGAQPRDWVWVEVRSASSADMTGDATGGCETDTDSNPPQFRATLIECRRLPTGQVSERVARLELGQDSTSGFGESDGPVVKSGEGSAGTSLLWSCKLPLPFALGEHPDLTYAVFVEEFLQAMPASFSNEPIRRDEDIKPGEQIIESGTRFAVRIEVN
ncbi:hypothetical protein [Mesorhizobium sp. B2-6-2]|uniref:hypothetical protein n=1 Tax=Mesorhizobium sp. B2-6-2 TaxID=2589915 RepID=UPI00112D3304|nr:hypothetical protein [Mesorhizobium sp. B2-6-2]TPJ77212.1 hypothetical protein FJ419_17020 [Mesorhizobium sp. B2-6-2]